MANTKTKTPKAVPTFAAMNPSAQTKAMNSVRSRGAKLRTDAIALANGFLLHYVAHGDMSNAMAIADVIGQTYTKGTRTAFINWCQTFTTSLRWNAKKGALEHDKSVKRELAKNTKGETHAMVSFFEFVQENTKPLDFKKRIASLIKSALDAIDDDTKPTVGYTKKDITDLQTFAMGHGWVDPVDSKAVETSNEEKKVASRKAAAIKENQSAAA